jgi:hypothetical protein
MTASPPPRPLLLLCVVALFAAPAAALDLHVSPSGRDSNPGTVERPLASLAGARDVLRGMKRTGPLREPVTVRFAAGVYPLTAPVVFGPEDSGSAAATVTFTAAPGTEVVFDGGRAISGWRRHDDRLWVASVPEAAAGTWRFRQLFVDGVQRPRARTPNSGFHIVAGFPEGTSKSVHYHTDCQSFQFAPGDIRADWTNLPDVEVIVYHFWTDSHLPIQSVDTARSIVAFQHKAGKVFTDDFTENGARYIVENVFEGLDSPGEWYLDRTKGLLFYYPMPGEDLRTASIIAPFAEAHLRLKGDARARRFVEHLHFRNLGFRHTNFHLPPGDSNDGQGSSRVASAIVLEAARSCSLSHLRLSNLGTFAFEVLAGSEDVALVGNAISRVAGGGFRVNGGRETDPPWMRTRGIRITDNVLEHYGQDYPSAVGLLVMNAEDVTVAHNRIQDGGYTGISVGWSWGYRRSVSQHNRVEFNHIHRIGLQGLLSDMGGIYTLGVSPGTVLRNNLIHDVSANHYGGWGIYNDEGSSNLLIENNIVHRTKFAPYNIHFARELTVRNNIFALGVKDQVSRGRAEAHKSVFFENNIVYWREGEVFSKNWNEEPYLFRAVALRPPESEKANFEADWNLYYNPNLARDDVVWTQSREAGGTLTDAKPTYAKGASVAVRWKDWQARGKDRNSLYADPMFRSPDAGDFTLDPASPAFRLGFRPIDVSKVGPRHRPGPE